MSTPDTAMHLDGALFIDGAWVAAVDGDSREVINPSDSSALKSSGKRHRA
jgi:acyl-CoA reductase-like NAD-dependent aldehyde dehydrogenase